MTSIEFEDGDEPLEHQFTAELFRVLGYEIEDTIICIHMKPSAVQRSRVEGTCQ